MQPKVYTFQEHQISRERVDAHAIFIIQKLKTAGHTAYLVGGGVRDLLLQQRPKDFDVSTSARPEEIRALFRNAILIGRRFRLAHIRFGKKIIEVSTFRSGDPDTSDLILRDNEWGSEEEDVLRRDFTINGLFYDPEQQTVIDYVGGFPDVEKKILRTIGQAQMRFMQDPVRMIRLLKFSARFNLYIDAQAHEALLGCKEHIIKSSSVRVLEELLRMLESGSSAAFFRQLYQYGLLKLLISPLAFFIELDTEERIFKILSQVDAEMCKVFPDTPDRSLPLAALCFPVFDLTVRHRMREIGKAPHLGEIAGIAQQMVEDLFAPFFRIPRRLKGDMISILTAQFRFTPPDGRIVHRPRLPRDSALPLSLQLFKMRASLDPDLLPLFTLWTEAAFQAPHSSIAQAPKERALRARRRRR